MKFKSFIKNKIDNYVILTEALADFSNLAQDIKDTIKEIKDKKEERKQKEEEIIRLREEKKKATNDAKKKLLNDKIKKAEAQAKKLAEEAQKLIDEKKRKEGESGESKGDDPEEESTGTTKPEVPSIEDVPLGKMKDGDVRKLIKYYRDMSKYLEGKMTGADSDKKANYKKRMSGFEIEIKDLNDELSKRKNK